MLQQLNLISLNTGRARPFLTPEVLYFLQRFLERGIRLSDFIVLITTLRSQLS